MRNSGVWGGLGESKVGLERRMTERAYHQSHHLNRSTTSSMGNHLQQRNGGDSDFFKVMWVGLPCCIVYRLPTYRTKSVLAVLFGDFVVVWWVRRVTHFWAAMSSL